MSVTKVVTEYHHSVCPIGFKYTVDIKLFGWSVFEGRLRRHFQHISNALFPLGGEEALDAFEPEVMAAKDVFQSLFRGS